MTDGAYAEVSPSSWSLSTLNPRTGTHSMLRAATDTKQLIRRVLGGARTTVGQAVAVHLDQLPDINNAYVLFDFRDTANVVQISVVIQSTGIIDILRGDNLSGVSIGASATPAVLAQAYQHIEAMATFNDTTGAVEVRVNGVTVISLTSVDTVSSLNQECSQVSIPCGNTIGTRDPQVVTFIDDYFCYDDTGSFNNTFIGDRRVLTLFPNADTAQADWGWNTGSSAYQAIDEPDPNDDTDYIFANPGGSPSPTSEFGMEDLPAGVSAISAVVLVNRMRKTDAGSANVQASLVSTATEVAGADRALTEQYTYYHDVVEADPDTAAPFTPAAVDAALLKVDRTV